MAKQKRKYFAVADVHGFYDEMIAALNAAGFDKDNLNHILINLGDAYDRGPASNKVVKFLLDLPKERRVLIRGNHEDLLEDIIKKNRIDSYDFTNGTVKTMAQFTGMSEFDPPEALIRETFYNPLYRQYHEELIDFYETKLYVFVHGWIPCKTWNHWRADNHEFVRKYQYQKDWREGDWRSAAWLNGMEAWNNGVNLYEKEGKTVFCGHWNASYGWSKIAHMCKDQFGGDSINGPYVDYGIVALDACTVLTHKVNCYVAEEFIDE